MKHFSDETRAKMSESAKRRCDDLWRKERSKKLETKLDSDLIKKMYQSGMTQAEIAERLGVTQKIIWRHMKNHDIPSRVATKRNQNGIHNHMWKGNSASYKAFHLRVKSARGLAKDYGCCICGTHNPDTWYDWANLSGRYEDVNNYAPMCRACHRKYDNGKLVINSAETTYTP